MRLIGGKYFMYIYMNVEVKELTEQKLVNKMKENKKISYSWYTFVGPLLVVLMIIVPLYLTHYDEPRVQNIEAEESQIPRLIVQIIHSEDEEEEEEMIVHNGPIAECDLFSGIWVYDEKSYPLYKERECSFVMDDYACVKYGRKDLKYQHWRWKPHECDLPRFNGTALLEKIRGKKIIFVGDSLNKNQWVSMLCLIESSLPKSASKSVIRTGNMLTFKANDYNATIQFYWSPFLVQSNNDDPIIHRLEDRVIRVGGIEEHARHWTDADILVFDSFLWWTKKQVTILWGSFESSDSIYKTVDTEPRIYEMALNTWSEWLEFNVNRTKTKLFFMSLSPTHEVGEDWYDDQNCYATKKPISKEEYWGIKTDRNMMKVAESTIRKLEKRGVKVEYLNITHMSDYRRDAHPSVYRQFYHNFTKEQLGNPKSYSDCTHWCLPGVPDVWNEILYAYLMSS